MPGWIPMPEVTALTSYTNQRNKTSCKAYVSPEECYRVVMGDKWHIW